MNGFIEGNNNGCQVTNSQMQSYQQCFVDLPILVDPVTEKNTFNHLTRKPKKYKQ